MDNSTDCQQFFIRFIHFLAEDSKKTISEINKELALKLYKQNQKRINRSP